MYGRGPYSSVPYSSLESPAEVGQPFIQTDWPNPVLRKRDVVTQLTWIDSFKLPLQGVLPPRQTDWPVPKGPRQPLDLLTWTQSYAQNLPTPVLNIMQYDWPNPRGPAYPTSLLTWTLSLTPSAMVFVPEMGRVQHDWPNPPPGRPRGPADWIRPSTSILTAPPATIPMSRMRDWPVPKAPPRSVSLLTSTGRLPNFPAGPSGPPQTTLANISGRVRWLENEVERTRFLAKNDNI